MTMQIASVLKEHKLSITDSRMEILNLFLSSNDALEHSLIEKETDKKFNRATVYRTLKSFIEKGIIHIIPSYDSSIRYALCKSNCDMHEHHDQHIHFQCDACKKTYCLEETSSPRIDLPEGFKTNHVDTLVSGLCKECN